MRHKRLAQWSIGFVALIFLSQAYLIARLFQVNYTFLEKVVSTITQDVYTKDMNFRLAQQSTLTQPKVELLEKGAKVDTTGAFEGGFNVDSMTGVDKSSRVSILNICIEMVLSKTNPIKLKPIDSLATILLNKDNIHTAFYTRIIDLNKDSVLESSKPGIILDSSPWISIKSKNIPLNLTQDRVLQLVLLNPLKTIFAQMAGMLILSFLLSLFCIYCLYILQRTLDRQKRLAQSKNDFFNQVSHELKKPVSVVYHAIDSLLNTKAIENAERRKRYMEISMTELHRMISKIDMILTLSMVDEGIFHLNRTNFNLSDLIEELKDRYFINEIKHIEFKVENLFDNPIVNADREHLYQCLSNLTDNAIKYSGESVQILYILLETEESFVISVKDNGQGIQEKDRERIFEKFERANSDKISHGYGIGLFYVKQIVKLHGGTINVRSEWGKWSEFSIRLPRMN
ncbi:MAG TPA: HAMP domain-containing sensor histidine kinase [Bacteroidales bacterium]|nr:HAMP domain-containing sensor histidine kinase [Bacteroidales bacterium]